MRCHLKSWLVFAIMILVISLILFGIRDYERGSLLEQNCTAIEELKRIVRPEPFNLKETEQILRDLRIDPNSAKGKRLIKGARKDKARERAELAPQKC